MITPCLHFDCDNKNSFGYCKTTCCINMKYNRQKIDELEPADVAPVVHGKWTKLFYDGFNCNKCGSTFVIMQGRNNMYYCPNCGAKMDGGENG